MDANIWAQVAIYIENLEDILAMRRKLQMLEAVGWRLLHTA